MLVFNLLDVNDLGEIAVVTISVVENCEKIILMNKRATAFWTIIEDFKTINPSKMDDLHKKMEEKKKRHPDGIVSKRKRKKVA
jgi:hypothetical protein